MADFAPLLTAGGGLGVLALVIVYLLASNRADRKQLNEQIDDAERRADAAEKRGQELQVRLDQALERSRGAEQREADHALEIKQLRREVDDLSQRIEQLQEQLR